MLIIVATKKRLYPFTTVILVNAIIYLVIIRKRAEKRYTNTYTCHYGCHGMLRDNRAEIIRKKLCKRFLSTSRSVIELNAERSNAGMFQVSFSSLDLKLRQFTIS